MLIKFHDVIHSDFLGRTIAFDTVSSTELSELSNRFAPFNKCIIVFAKGHTGAGYDYKFEEIIQADDCNLADRVKCHIAVPVLLNDDAIERSQFILEIAARRQYKTIYIVNIDISRPDEAREKIIAVTDKIADSRLKIADEKKEGKLSSRELLQCFFARPGSKDRIFKSVGYEQSKFDHLVNYSLKRDAVIMLALAMKLDLNETDYFLQLCGFVLSSSDRDKTIKECIVQKKHDINIVNKALHESGHQILKINNSSSRTPAAERKTE